MCLYGGRDNFCFCRFSLSRLHIAHSFCLFKSLRSSSMFQINSCGLLCREERKEERKLHLTDDVLSISRKPWKQVQPSISCMFPSNHLSPVRNMQQVTLKYACCTDLGWHLSSSVNRVNVGKSCMLTSLSFQQTVSMTSCGCQFLEPVKRLACCNFSLIFFSQLPILRDFCAW